MGCCHSTNSSPHEAPHEANARNVPFPQHSSGAALEASLVQNDGIPPSMMSHLIVPSSRPNLPIRAPSPLARSPKNTSPLPPPWTRSWLERQRREFFETRVSGHAEIWATLERVCGLLQQNNIAEAQVLLNAGNIACPDGRFARGRGRTRDGRHKGGVYDEQGFLYDIPDWAVTDPADIIEDSHEKEIDAGSDGTHDDEVGYEDGKGPTSPGKEDKGKGRADDVDLGEKVQVRARPSNSDKDVVVSAHSRQPARVVVEQIKEKIGGGNVRLMFKGKSVDESKPLSEYGWTTKDVVNAFVLNDPAAR